MLVDTAELVREAEAKGSAVGAFNVILLEQAEAYAAAAVRAESPLILQISENAVKYHRGQLAPIAAGVLAVAEQSSAPIAVHLDHVEEVELGREAIKMGLSSLMFDGSPLPYKDNVKATAALATEAHRAGLSVEAELGEVGGKDGVHSPTARTDPAEARTFVQDTGVDMLAVAVGSSHAMTTRDAVLDTDLIARLQAEVPVPLVLHGSSGVSDQGMVEAIRAGISKINVATHFNAVFTAEVRRVLAENPNLTDPRKYLGPATKKMEDEATRLLRLYAAI